MPSSFNIVCRIYWEDTDAGGVVYYANYLKFLERCRTEWLGAMGINQLRLRAERGMQFAVVKVIVDFLRPALLHDEILVTAAIEELRGATIWFTQTIERGNEKLIDASTRVACLDSVSLKPRGIPKDMFTEWRGDQ